MQELLERIKREQDFFPTAQRQVAAYVVENYYQIPFLTISMLAKNIGVSDSTIIKFCNQLGFEKFAEFKRVFSNFAHSELTMYDKLSQSTMGEDQDGELFTIVMEEAVANIRSTLSNPTNRNNLAVLMQMMGSAKSIYVTGGRSSAILANYFASTLRYLGLTVYSIDGGICDYLDQISMAGEKDLVIALCFPRYTSLIVNSLQELHKSKIPVVLITDTGLSPAYPYADLVFHCSVSSDAYFPCYASCMSLISTICRAMGVNQKPSASEHIRKLEKRLLESGVFI